MNDGLAVAGTVLLVLVGGVLRLSLTSENARDLGSYSSREWRIAAVTVVLCLVAGIAAFLVTR